MNIHQEDAAITNIYAFIIALQYVNQQLRNTRRNQLDINYRGEYTCLPKIGRPRGAKNHKDMEDLYSTMNSPNLMV